jgi:hypothetical protein
MPTGNLSKEQTRCGASRRLAAMAGNPWTRDSGLPLTSQKPVPAVPFEMLPCRPVVGVGGEGDLLVLQAGEQVRRFAGFGDVAVGGEDGAGGVLFSKVFSPRIREVT